VKTVQEMEGRLASRDAAFDMTTDQEDDTAYQAPASYLEDRRFDPALQLEESNWAETNARTLQQALLQLDERCQDILKRRWMDEEKATLHQLAEQYGVSAERIRQLEKNALKKLKTHFIA
jgi:RNA polymerase sigma-32 factor